MIEYGRIGPVEWAAVSLALFISDPCGDRAVVVDAGDAALFGVLDGLGHGPEAARASRLGAEAIKGDNKPLEALMQIAHRAMFGTRGAAVTLARIDFELNLLSWTGIGNVSANLMGKGPAGTEVRFSARLDGGIVGDRMPSLLYTRAVPIHTGDLLLMATDGIDSTHLDYINFQDTAKEIAEALMRRCRIETDDALILAVRHRGSPLP